MKKLLDEVSVDELLHLRNEGKSNQEIADLLDVSRQTVYKHIGKQPSRKALDAMIYGERVSTPVEPKKPVESLLRQTGRSFAYRDDGVSFFTDIQFERGIASITSGLNAFGDAGLKIKMDKIAPLIAMLQELEALHDEYKALGLL